MIAEGLDTSVARVRLLIEQEPLPPESAGALVDGLLRLCGAAIGALGASGAGVSMVAGSQTPAVAASSDPVSQRMEEMQFIVGEGPCIDALSLRRPVLQPELDGGLFDRWPAYTAAALAHGVQAVFSFPLQVGAARLGVLDLYRSEPGSLRPDHLALALNFAEVAVTMLLDGQENAASGKVDAGLSEALAYRAEIYHAQGMVMVQLRISLSEALVRLRAHAYAEDRRLADVAQDVVNGDLVLPDTGP